MDFKNLNVSENLALALSKIGINKPTPIQENVIPSFFEGNCIIAESNTGTGKTMSFLVPIIDNIMNGKLESVLVLAPTRELVIQISQEADKIIDNLKRIQDVNITVLPIYGGKDIKSQINKLKNNINIIVATPGRLLDHLNRNTIDLSSTSCIIIDEADQMLLMGFKNEIDSTLKNVKKIKQIVLLSATIDSKVNKLAYNYSDSFDIISSKKSEDIPDSIQQYFVETTARQKFDDFCDVLNKDNPFMAIVFCRTKARVDNLDLKLAQAGYNCDKIHSDISQAKRERILKNFRNMKTQILISTDLASRGLDINGITHIYNYDLPESAQDYIHRIGRTGRIGKDGVSCSFVTDPNSEVYNEILKIIKKNKKNKKE